MLTHREQPEPVGASAPVPEGAGQGDRTRAKILAAAVELIDERGEAGLRVVDVGARAGVAVASIYTYFLNRDDLVISARIEQFLGVLSGDLEHLALVIQQVDNSEQMQELLRQVARATIDPERIDSRWRRAEVLGAARTRPTLAARVAAQQHESNAELCQIVQHAQGKGLVDPTLDPMAIAVFVQGYTFGLLLAEVDPESEFDHEAWLDVVDRFIGSIVI